jgi:hypothetical protein
MSLLDSFMLSHNDECDTTMGVSVMVCDGQTFNVVANLSTKTIDGDTGGLEPSIQNMVTAQPSDVTEPRRLINKRCTVDGISYRVHGVDVGTIAIHFSLIDPNESR